MQVYKGVFFSYTSTQTADGSPSLIVSDLAQQNMLKPETMHSRHGALTESLYIYYENANSAYQKGLPYHYLSVGLGLGYNEALVSALILNQKVELNKVQILSFESDAVIRESYRAWLINDEIDPFWQKAFDEVLEKVGLHFSLSTYNLKNILFELFQSSQFIIEKDLTQFDLASAQYKYSSIFYDAYSNQATPILWSEEFLTRFINKLAEQKCIFTTYAATGALNRSLKANNFTLAKRKGFQFKRESTWAER